MVLLDKVKIWTSKSKMTPKLYNFDKFAHQLHTEQLDFDCLCQVSATKTLQNY